MIAIDKNKVEIPTSLTDKTRLEAFEENVKKKKHILGDKYRTNEVSKLLNELYNKKCAYCEDTLLNAPKSIEHYRPKNSAKRKNCNSDNSYFWLAFSWDNLLLSCTSCNSSKGSCFDINGQRVTHSDYKEYSLDDLQSTIKDLDKQEKPLLVNPEQVTKSFLRKNLDFDFNGQISSTNKQLEYTIRICNLNRNELVKKRKIIINDLINLIKEKKMRFINHRNTKRYKEDLMDISKTILNKIKKYDQFTAWQKFLIQEFKNIEKQTLLINE